jgi:DNA topoisomerase-1
LPREVGLHPESGKPITAGIGRYGPFVEHEGKYANLDSVDEVFTVGHNRAVALLAEKQGRGGRTRATPSALKELGEHPTQGGAVTVRSGRYGPYVNHGKLNATLPRGMNPEGVTMERAVELLAAKEAKAGVGRPSRPAPKARARAKAK